MTVARSPRIWRVRPSAIWLRAELATQRKRMRFIVGFLPRLLDGLAVAADGGAGLVPALAGVHDLHDREHDRHLDEHTDHGGERRAGLESDTHAGRGPHTPESTARAGAGRGCGPPVPPPT